MGKEKRALAVTLLMVLVVVLATGLYRNGPHDDETVLAALAEGVGGAASAASTPSPQSAPSPRRLSITRVPEPATPPGDSAERMTTLAKRGDAAAAPTRAPRDTLGRESAAGASPEPSVPATAAREGGTAAAISGDDEGRLPGVAIDYRDVGFDRYFRLVESMGALFVLMHDNRLGPRVSLRRGGTIPGGIPGNLVKERPHVITDPRLLQRLDTVSLPGDARRDRLVLLLTRRADRALWQGVTDALSRKGLALSSVALVTGAYVESGRGVSIRFDAATLRDGGSTVPLTEAGRRRNAS